MASKLNPYLSFRDNAREVMEFYRSVFGGELSVDTFGDQHASEDPDDQKLVMHAQLETPSGFTIMASDTPKSMGYNPGSATSISISGEASDDAELRGFWGGLSDGATITMPLGAAPWGGDFGMLTDKYGTPWMVSISPAAD